MAGIPFTCPRHGVIDGLDFYEIEAATERRRPLAPAWDGGPLIEDAGQPERLEVLDRILTTDACPCRFKLSEWNLVLTMDPSGAPLSVAVVAKS